jgi:hypothetical protein
MTFSTLAGSAADLVVDNVVFQNDFLDHILAEGVLLSNEGLLRVQFSNNEINEFDGFGLLVQTGGTGRTLGNFFNNRVFSNGPLQDEGAPPHEDGVRFANFGNATANIRFVDNLITENFEQGLTLTTAQTSQMNFEMTGNVIAYNDQGGPNPPDQFVFDMLVVNGINANIGLSMSTNAFLLPAAIDNNSGAPAFILELDGTTNGVGFPTIVGGPVTQAQFGSTVDPAIAAEEAAFIGLGF